MLSKLRTRIGNIRNCLDKIHTPTGVRSGEVSVQYWPVSDFDDKSSYPIEFQVFMEVIGEVHIQSSYLVLNLETPKSLLGIFDRYNCDDDETNITVLDDWKYDDIYSCGRRAQDVKIIANDADAMLYGFDVTKSPYQFLDSFNGVERNFLEWFVDFYDSRLR